MSRAIMLCKKPLVAVIGTGHRTRTCSTGTIGRFILMLTMAGGVPACAPELGGRASFPLVSRSSLSAYERIAGVDEMRCAHNAVILVWWGDDANHEALISDILERYKGDAIGDAKLTFHSIPALLYNRLCARVEGTVLRRRGTAPPPQPQATSDGGARRLARLARLARVEVMP